MLLALLSCSFSISAGNKLRPIYLLGDEQVCMQDSVAGVSGWGVVLRDSLEGKALVFTRAQQGNSTHKCLADSSWTKLLAELKKKDVLIIQLGINDMNESDSTTYAPIAEYETNLMRMIEDAQKKKVQVILSTPVALPLHRDGKLYSRLGAYPEAVRRLAERMEVTLWDVELEMSSAFARLNEDGVKAYYTNDRLSAKGMKYVARLAKMMLVDNKIITRK